MDVAKIIHGLGGLGPLDIPKLCKMVGFNSTHDNYDNYVRVPLQTLLDKTSKNVHEHVMFLYNIT